VAAGVALQKGDAVEQQARDHALTEARIDLATHSPLAI
jgi:hypothetical protein